MSDHSELKKLAEAATAGDWHHYRHGVIKGGPAIKFTNGSAQQQIAMTTGTNWMRADEQCANADFIAAANPAAVLALIAELEQSQLIGRISCNFDGYKAVLDERDQLKAEVEALKDQLEHADELVVIREKQVKELFREREPMKKNSDRYLWTTIEGNWVARMFGKWRAHIGEYGDKNPTEWFDTREEAIDAAMGEGEKP